MVIKSHVKIFLLVSMIILLANFALAFSHVCYQESVDNGVICGGGNDGTTQLIGGGKDGNWNTYEDLGCDGCHRIVSYRIPANVISAVVQVKWGGGIINYTVPQSCLSGDYLNFYISDGGGVYDFGCNDGNWVEYSAGGVSYVYEEGVFWTIDVPIYPNGGEVFTGESVDIAWSGISSYFNLSYYSNSSWYEIESNIPFQNFSVINTANLTEFYNANGPDPFGVVAKNETHFYTLSDGYPVLTGDMVLMLLDASTGTRLAFTEITVLRDGSTYHYQREYFGADLVYTNNGPVAVVGGLDDNGQKNNLTIFKYDDLLTTKISQQYNYTTTFGAQTPVATEYNDKIYVFYSPYSISELWFLTVNKTTLDIITPPTNMSVVGKASDAETDGEYLYLVYATTGDFNGNYTIAKLNSSMDILVSNSDFGAHDVGVKQELLASSDCKIFYSSNLSFITSYANCYVCPETFGYRKRLCTISPVSYGWVQSTKWNDGGTWQTYTAHTIFSDSGTALVNSPTIVSKPYQVSSSSLSIFGSATDSHIVSFITYPLNVYILDIEPLHSYSWNISDKSSGADYKIKVTNDTGEYVTSNSSFAIDKLTQTSFVSSPTGQYSIGDQLLVNLTEVANGIGENYQYNLEYSNDSGVTWNNVFSGYEYYSRNTSNPAFDMGIIYDGTCSQSGGTSWYDAVPVNDSIFAMYRSCRYYASPWYRVKLYIYDITSGTIGQWTLPYPNTEWLGTNYVGSIATDGTYIYVFNGGYAGDTSYNNIPGLNSTLAKVSLYGNQVGFVHMPFMGTAVYNTNIVVANGEIYLVYNKDGGNNIYTTILNSSSLNVIREERYLQSDSTPTDFVYYDGLFYLVYYNTVTANWSFKELDSDLVSIKDYSDSNINTGSIAIKGDVLATAACELYNRTTFEYITKVSPCTIEWQYDPRHTDIVAAKSSFARIVYGRWRIEGIYHKFFPFQTFSLDGISTSSGGEILVDRDDEYLSYNIYTFAISNNYVFGGIGANKNFIFNYTSAAKDFYLDTTLLNPGLYQLRANSKDSYTTTDWVYSSNFSLRYVRPTEYTVVYPGNNSILERQLYANLTVNVYEPDIEDNVSVTFYDGNDNILCDSENITSQVNTTLNCFLTNLTPGQKYYWYVAIFDGTTNLTTPVYSFTPNDEPKVYNMRISDVNSTNVLFEWENEPNAEWIAFKVGNAYLEVRKITGVTQYWLIPSLYPNQEYNFEFQLGDNLSSNSDYHDWYFRTSGWNEDTEMIYRRLIVLNHSQMSDCDGCGLNITLTEENFKHIADWTEYPSFTHINWTQPWDIRFMNYYDTMPLRFDIKSWDIHGDGGISYQTTPDETGSEGTWNELYKAYDGDWLTQATANPEGVYYYNYTIPAYAKTTSVFRIYDGGWGYDFELPIDCYGGTKLRFKSIGNYSASPPYVYTYCQNNTDDSWILIRNNNVDEIIGTSPYVYETMITWKYYSTANIIVVPTHFDYETQNDIEGVDGDYDVKLWMYYGHDSDWVYENNESTLTGLTLVDAYILGEEESLMLGDPTITNVQSYGLTSTTANISWTSDQSTNNRVQYATNPWILDATWAIREVEDFDTVDHVNGDVSVTSKLKVWSEDYLETILVNCSVPAYCSNYTLNSNTSGQVEFTTQDVNYAGFIDWIIYYRENKTVDRDTGSPKFMLIDLEPNTQYWYRVWSYGTDGEAYADGTFTLGELPPTPAVSITTYEEQRPNKQVTVCANLEDMNNESSLDCSFQYFNEESTTFEESTPDTLTSTGEYCQVLNVEYGHDYTYRAKCVGTTTGYSEPYENEFGQIQGFFAGNPVEDGNDGRDRQWCWGGIDTPPCFEQTGYLEGSLQQEDWIWVETNISDRGQLTVNWWNGDNWHEYPMTADNDSIMQYVEITGLDDEWHTFYVTDGSDDVVLNWTKPSLIHLANEPRVEESKYVSFGGVPRELSYELMYMDYEYYNLSAYRWCIEAGGSLYDCMAVEYFGGGKEAGLPDALTGTKYDRGQYFRGGIINGEMFDTGVLRYERPNKTMGAERHCFSFTSYWFDESVLASNNITNYYVRYWSLDDMWSEYLGYPQSRLFDQLYLMYFGYDLISYTRDWKAYEGTETYTEMVVDTATPFVFQSDYPQSLIVNYKDGFQVDVSDSKIFDFGFYTDGRWTNQQVGEHQQAFVIFNLPDNVTLQGMDTDTDGVNDYDELWVYYTNPKSFDTDEDGFSDGYEVNQESNPNDWTETTKPCYSDWVCAGYSFCYENTYITNLTPVQVCIERTDLGHCYPNEYRNLSYGRVPPGAIDYLVRKDYNDLWDSYEYQNCTLQDNIESIAIVDYSTIISSPPAESVAPVTLVTFVNKTILGAENLTTYVSLEPLKIIIDTGISPQYSEPATLEFREVPYKDPGVYVNRDDGKGWVNCPSYVCSNYNYDFDESTQKGNFTFDVSGFSGYFVGINTDIAPRVNGVQVLVFGAFSLMALILLAAAAFVVINIFKDGADSTAIIATVITIIGLAIALFIGYVIIGMVARTIGG